MEIQSDLNVLSMWSDDAAQQLKITVDQDVLGGIVGQMALRPTTAASLPASSPATSTSASRAPALGGLQEPGRPATSSFSTC
jgi:hypothetical protein